MRARRTCRRAAVLPLLLSAACASHGGPPCPADAGGAPRPEGPGWYHGPVVSVDSSRVPGGGGWIRNVMVQVEPAGRTTGRISFSVSEGTVLLCRSGARVHRAAPLPPGMEVSARTRMIMESDPAYASTDTLILGPPP